VVRFHHSPLIYSLKLTTMSIRICTKCKLEKDLLNDYHRCQKNELRRKTVCKPCALKIANERNHKKELERNYFY